MIGPASGQAARPQLTLLAPVEALERLRTAPIVARHARNGGVVRRLHETYFDTPDQALFNQGMALRVQRTGARQVQRLSLASRDTVRQWETPVNGAAPELSRLPAAEVPNGLLQVNGDLAPVFARVVRCRVQRLQLPDALVQLVASEGRIEAGIRAEPVAEVRLELQSGNAAALYELGSELLQIAPMQLATVSECERGFALARAAVRQPSKPTAPDIARFHLVDDAMAVVLESCRQHLLCNHAVAQDGRDPEGVHQIRVALRRLRSALWIFRRAVPSPTLHELGHEAKWLASALGPARDWDVFLTETLPVPEQACAPALSFDRLRAAAASHHEAAYAAVRDTLAATRATRFLLALGGWIERRGWRSEVPSESLAVLSEPVVNLAAALLIRLHSRALKHGAHLRHSGPAERHTLRIRLKRLRYACEFFQPLWPDTAGERFIGRLARLQTALGSDSDAQATGSLLQSIAADATEPELHRAIGGLIGWQACDRLQALGELRERWRRFKNAPPFWQA